MMNHSPADTALSRAMIRWSLSRAEPVDETASNWLYRVEQDGRRAAAVSILKPDASALARRSLAMLHWYQGEGAIAVYDEAGDTALMEWVEGEPLATRLGEADLEPAVTAFSDVVSSLHARRAEPPPTGLIPLRQHLSPLLDCPVRDWPASARDMLIRTQAIGRQVLDQPEAELPLHGNLTFDAIVSSERGWLATSPLGLFGEATYDAATAFLGSVDDLPEAAATDRTAALLNVLVPRLSLPPRRLLGFAVLAVGRVTALSIAEEDQAGPLFGLLASLLAAHAQA